MVSWRNNVFNDKINCTANSEKFNLTRINMLPIKYFKHTLIGSKPIAENLM